MFNRREGVSFGVKNGNRNEMLYLYDKPYRGKSNGIYADIGESKEKVIEFIEEISPYLTGIITNFTCHKGYFTKEEVQEEVNYSKGSSFKVKFEYKDIYGVEANIYIPSIKAEYTLEIAKILKKLDWKLGKVALKVNKVRYTQRF